LSSWDWPAGIMEVDGCACTPERETAGKLTGAI
jgi:hypothetical protein